MRDPPREEQWNCGLSRIGRIHARNSKKVTGVIQRHENHNHAAQEIDGLEPQTAQWDG